MKTSSPSTDPKTPSGLRLIALQGAALLIMLGIVFGIAEVTLRLFPQWIGLAALKEFDPGLREEIASRLDLPTVRSAIHITPEERVDHGREILLPGANSIRTTLADQNDLALGAIEEVHVDENGFCNDPSQSAGGKADIIIAGDSFTFCTAVRVTDSAAYKLQQLTGRTTYNVGVHGVGPDEYLELARRQADRLHPQIVVFNVYEGNDLRDVMRERDFLAHKSKKKTDGESSPAISYALEFLRANFHLFAKSLKDYTATHDFHYAATVNGATMEMNTANSDQDEVENAFRLQRGDVSLDLFATPLTNFVTWAKANGITPVVVYTPSMYTAYDSTVTFSDAKVGEAVRNLSHKQREWFAQNAARLGFTFRDLTPAFQKEADAGNLTHFPSNVHLTPLGQTVVAQQLADIIKGM